MTPRWPDIVDAALTLVPLWFLVGAAALAFLFRSELRLPVRRVSSYFFRRVSQLVPRFSLTVWQRRVLIIAGATAILMLLYPPFETRSGHFLGYSAVVDPPSYGDRWDPVNGRVSLPYLGVQYAALAVCAGAALLLCPRQRR